MISGVGLLLLTITNRMGRVVDRIRHLVSEIEKIPQDGVVLRAIKIEEIEIFYRRAKLLRNSVAWIMVGMISSCLLIPLLFIMSLGNIDLRTFGYAFFLIATAAMLTAFVYFFKDVLLSLHAIKLETSSVYTLR
jgi:hypothetical protein